MTQAVLWSACGLLPFAVRLTNALASAENWTFIHEPKRSEWTSLPQHFKKAGWWAAGAGKLYHPGSPQHEDNPLSWSVEYPEDVGGGCSCTPMANYCRLPDNTTCYDVQLTVRMRGLRPLARLVPESSDGGSCVQDIVVGDLHTHHDNATLGEMPFFLGLGVHKPVRPSCSVRCAVSLTRTPVVSTCHGRCPAASLICTRLRRKSRLPLTLTSRPTCHRSPGTNAPVRPRHHPPVSFRVCSNVVAETLVALQGRRFPSGSPKERRSTAPWPSTHDAPTTLRHHSPTTSSAACSTQLTSLATTNRPS